MIMGFLSAFRGVILQFQRQFAWFLFPG